MRERLESGDNLILFPEGTSSDGLRIQSFKSAFFAAAEHPVRGRPLTVQPVSLGYSQLNHMPVGRRWLRIFSWVGDADLVPRLCRFPHVGPTAPVGGLHPASGQARVGRRWCV